MTTPNDEDRAIKRYTFDDEYCSANFTDSCEANMEEKADGAYVLYSDHVAALAAERAKVWKDAIEIVNNHTTSGRETAVEKSLRWSILSALKAAATQPVGKET